MSRNQRPRREVTLTQNLRKLPERGPVAVVTGSLETWHVVQVKGRDPGPGEQAQGRPHEALPGTRTSGLAQGQGKRGGPAFALKK